ncbi:MAG: hypothetical protein U0235_16995 [Polyangiaceae bacterium]
MVEVGIAVGKNGSVIARYNWLINPGIPISEESRAVHHISDDDVKDSPRFEGSVHEDRDRARWPRPGGLQRGLRSRLPRERVRADSGSRSERRQASARPPARRRPGGPARVGARNSARRSPRPSPRSPAAWA